MREPEEFIKQVRASSHFLGEREVGKLISKVQSLIDQRNDVLYDFELYQITLREDPPNSYNGYRRLSLQRIAQAISYFEQHIGNLYKTKLNKLLFYADFLAYKHRGHSITGLQYRAIPFGPVPAEYGRLYLRLQDDGQVSVEERNGKDDQYLEVFSEEEIRILQSVAQWLSSKNTGEIVRFSHEEQAWKDNEGDRQLIDYQRYAFGVGDAVESSD